MLAVRRRTSTTGQLRSIDLANRWRYCGHSREVLKGILVNQIGPFMTAHEEGMING
jgi:hypothetical protein